MPPYPEPLPPVGPQPVGLGAPPGPPPVAVGTAGQAPPAPPWQPPPMAGAPGPSRAQPLTREDVEVLIRAAAKEQGVDPDFAVSIAEQESGLNAEIGTSRTGDRGIMQLSPGTVKQFGVQNPDDPYENVVAGVRMLSALHREHQGDLRKVARRYNASPQARDEVTDFYVQEVFKKFRKRVGLPDPKPGEDTDGRTPMAPVPGHRTDPRADAPVSMTGDARDPLAPKPGELPAWQQKLQTVGMDPSTPEGKVSIGATVGGLAATGGASVLAKTGLPILRSIGPWTKFYAGIAGAGLGGGGGQAINEYVGAPPAPGAPVTPQERIMREGEIQAFLEFLPAPVLGTLKGITRAALEEGISVATKNAFARARAGTREEFNQALAALKTTFRQEQDRLAQTGADLTVSNRALKQDAARTGETEIGAATTNLSAAQQELDRVRDETARALQLTTRQGSADVRGVRQAQLVPAHRALEDTRAARTTAIAAERRGGALELRNVQRAADATAAQRAQMSQGAVDVARSNYLKVAAERPVRDLPAGNAVAAMVDREGPVQAVQDTLGRTVAEEAAKGPKDLSIKELRNEMVGVIERELVPLIEKFPAKPEVPPMILGADGKPLRPTPPAPKDQTVEQVAEATRRIAAQQLAEHPAMQIVAQLANHKGNTVEMGKLHGWYSQLANANSDVFEPGLRTKVEGIKAHLLGLIRKTLAGAQHAPYEKAALEYTELMDLFKKADYSKIQKMAETQPAKIAQLLNVDNPDQAGALMRVLTEVPGRKGGSQAGFEQGRKAAQAVQDAFLNRHLFDGGIENLTDRLAKLDARPEFTEALFAGQPSHVVENARALAKAWQDSLAAQELQKVSAAAGKKTAEEAAAERTAASMARTRQTTGEAVAAARARVRGGQDAVDAAGERARQARIAAQDAAYTGTKKARIVVDEKQARVEEARRLAKERNTTVAEQAKLLEEAHDKNVREARSKAAQALQDKRAERSVRTAKTPEELEFEDSSLAPANLHRSKNGFYTTVRRALTAIAGIHAFGYGGAALIFAEKGAAHATEADILKYVANDDKTTQRIVRYFAASQLPNRVVGAGVRAGSAASGITPQAIMNPPKKKDADKDKK